MDADASEMLGNQLQSDFELQMAMANFGLLGDARPTLPLPPPPPAPPSMWNSGFEAYGTITTACSSYTESMDGSERRSVNSNARTGCPERVDGEEHYRTDTDIPAHSGWTFKFNFFFLCFVQKSLRHEYGYGHDRPNSAIPTPCITFHDPDPPPV